MRNGLLAQTLDVSFVKQRRGIGSRKSLRGNE